jgi:hypothetical protein
MNRHWFVPQVVKWDGLANESFGKPADVAPDALSHDVGLTRSSVSIAGVNNEWNSRAWVLVKRDSCGGSYRIWAPQVRPESPWRRAKMVYFEKQHSCLMTPGRTLDSIHVAPVKH